VLLALTNGTAWRNSNQTVGRRVEIPANFGTLGSQAKWSGKVYIARNETPFAPDPTILPYNVLSAATFHATANKTKQQPLSTSTPSASVNFPVQSSASLLILGAAGLMFWIFHRNTSTVAQPPVLSPFALGTNPTTGTQQLVSTQVTTVNYIGGPAYTGDSNGQIGK
jgi:hypothetical protein